MRCVVVLEFDSQAALLFTSPPPYLSSPLTSSSPPLLLVPARAAQLPRLPYIILALAGLVVYDVVSVVGTQQFTDGGASIMEAVARAKAGMPSISTMISVPPESIAAAASSALPAAQSLATSAPAAAAAASQFLVPSLSSWRPGRRILSSPLTCPRHPLTYHSPLLSSPPLSSPSLPLSTLSSPSYPLLLISLAILPQVYSR